ncbi:tagaturonate reductase [Christiangramia flava]|uniref:Altronate oxidoreductase n=1 Tax=Christiangramia flava JLT2011 TaxID=1229726 RepID=A0A1L7I6P7_9FLAO|nr:tagaturonate reductase [Christiangramia flava]APU68894.1 Altronate oxidoreductase [Christiangramia flava JLT2011]OSS38960.1 Altronate oxidoreductase [Christiangramia flava JLT2011]
MEKTLNKQLNRENTGLQEKLPIKVVQFGEGNFLRAFVDYIIDKLNKQADFNAGVAVVQPLPKGMIHMLNDQDGLYNLFMKGVKKGKEIQQKETVSCIQKSLNPYDDYEAYLKLAEEESLEFVISNTTEAGIAFDENDTLEGAPHNSFPAKLTALLYRRFQHFDGAAAKALTIIPCELINYNADTLKEIILKYAQLWDLGPDFQKWIEEETGFHNTLVDRIVPGYPAADIDGYQKELEYKDNLIVSAEVFLLWVIEGDAKLKSKIPFDKIDENIRVVQDMQPYRTRKVRILNGAHTTMVPFSIMYGNETVKETLDDDFTGKFVKKAIFEEIIPTLDLPKEELESFASDVLDRFRNPFIKHQLSSIALNSISKFKVRVLPSLLAYAKDQNSLPQHLVFALACLIRFYGDSWKGSKLPVNDDEAVVSQMQAIWKTKDYQAVSEKVLGHTGFWEQDLTEVPDLQEAVASALKLIDEKGVQEAFQEFEKQTN